MKADRHDESMELFRKNGFHVISEESLEVKLANQPGELAKLAKTLSDESVNILHFHIIDIIDKDGFFGITCDNMEKAKSLLNHCVVK